MEGPIVVMDDEIDLLTCEEVLSGVMLDPETLFAYKILPDGTPVLKLSTGAVSSFVRTQLFCILQLL